MGTFSSFGWLVLLTQEKLPYNSEMTFVFPIILETRLGSCFAFSTLASTQAPDEVSCCKAETRIKRKCHTFALTHS